MEVHLLVLDGAHQGLKIALPPTQFVIGRDPECHLRPASADVSRFHCAIARLGQQVLVRDLKSRNGSFLNDERIYDTRKVGDGDVLRIGPLHFRFQIAVGPAALERQDGSLSWLVRSPDTCESQALDPNHETVSLGYIENAAADLSRQADEPDAHRRLGSAIAGDFLREYLSRRKQSSDKK